MLQITKANLSNYVLRQKIATAEIQFEQSEKLSYGDGIDKPLEYRKQAYLNSLIDVLEGFVPYTLSSQIVEVNLFSLSTTTFTINGNIISITNGTPTSIAAALTSAGYPTSFIGYRANGSVGVFWIQNNLSNAEVDGNTIVVDSNVYDSVSDASWFILGQASGTFSRNFHTVTINVPSGGYYSLGDTILVSGSTQTSTLNNGTYTINGVGGTYITVFDSSESGTTVGTCNTLATAAMYIMQINGSAPFTVGEVITITESSDLTNLPIGSTYTITFNNGSYWQFVYTTLSNFSGTLSAHGTVITGTPEQNTTFDLLPPYLCNDEVYAIVDKICCMTQFVSDDKWCDLNGACIVH